MKNLWILLLLFAVSLQAQWVDDPGVNTVVQASAGAKYVAKVAVTPDGNYFFSWYGGASNLDMNLSYLDHSGVHVWEEGTIKVSTFPQNSWIDDYTMVSDLEGNAIVVFSDIRNGNKDVVVYKIDPEGNQIFGEEGIVFPVPGSDEYEPNVIVTSDNQVVVLFSTNYSNGSLNKIMAHKIDAEGNLAWGSLGKTFSGVVNWSLPQGIPNEDGGFSFGYYQESGTFPALTRHIALIRCDADGNEVWDSPAIATNAGGVSAWADLMVKGDGNGGAYFIWYDDRYFDNMAESYVQWINGSGIANWTTNGVLLSQESGFFQFYPMISGTNLADELVVFWNKVNSNQSMAALMMQRIDLGGNLLETINGKTVLPINAQLSNGIKATQFGDSTYYLYNRYQDGSSYLTNYNFIGLDKSGNPLWPNPIEIVNSPKDRSHPHMSDWHSYQAVICWTDDMLGGNRTMAQNVFTDGALGSSPVRVEEPLMEDQKHYFVAFQNNTHHLILQGLEGNEMLKIYNMKAQEVYEAPAQNHQQLNRFMKGMYVAVLMKEGKILEHYKLIM